MSRLLTLLLVLSTPLFSGGQSIQAGYASGTDFYYDYDPDTLVISYHAPNHINSFPIDMDGDWIPDFNIELKDGWGAMGSFLAYVRIVPLQNNQVANVYVHQCITDNLEDTTYYPMVKSFSPGLSIDETWDWSSDPQYLKYKALQLYHRNCSSGSGGPIIIGTRISTSQGSLYGWIKIKDIVAFSDGSRAIVEEYACKRFVLNTEENDLSFNLYPNPAEYLVRISLDKPTEDVTVNLLNVHGALVSSFHTDAVQSIDVPMPESKGIYFVQLLNAKGFSQTSKVIRK